MYAQYTTCPLNQQASEEQAEELGQQVEQFLHPLLLCLDLVDKRLVRTFVHQRTIQLKVLALPVHHPEPVLASQILWLVVCRRDHHLPPWYLLTAEPITDADDLWTLVFAYSRRWQIEHMWRACKNELAFERPRLHAWEHRRRLLPLASLADAFLLELMKPPWEGTRDWVMPFWCRRTGPGPITPSCLSLACAPPSVSSGLPSPLPFCVEGDVFQKKPRGWLTSCSAKGTCVCGCEKPWEPLEWFERYRRRMEACLQPKTNNKRSWSRRGRMAHVCFPNGGAIKRRRRCVPCQQWGADAKPGRGSSSGMKEC